MTVSDLCTCDAQMQPHDRVENVCPLPCLKPDFPGDTCENWVEYGIERCANCEANRG